MPVDVKMNRGLPRPLNHLSPAPVAFLHQSSTQRAVGQRSERRS